MAGGVQRKLKLCGFGGVREGFHAEVDFNGVVRKACLKSLDPHHDPVNSVLLSLFHKWVSCVLERKKYLPKMFLPPRELQKQEASPRVSLLVPVGKSGLKVSCAGSLAPCIHVRIPWGFVRNADSQALGPTEAETLGVEPRHLF